MTKKIKLKDKRWKLFSKYIRLKHADKNGYCTCVTCGAKYLWDSGRMHAGHYVNSRNNSVLFNEDLVYPQCDKCNIFNAGEQARFTLYLLKNGYSRADLEGFLSLRRATKKISDAEHLEAIEELKDKLVALDIQRGAHD